MSLLLGIQEFIQQTVDAISGVIDFDVAIIDDSISLVAGSGKYKNKIGYNFGNGSVTSKLLNGNVFSEMEILMVETPHDGDLCSDCETKHECDISAALMCPIKFETRVAGTISLFAVNETQKDTIMVEMDKLGNFLKKISSLISSKIGEKELHNRALELDKKFSSVVDNLTEGILSYNGDGTITQCNKSALKIIKTNYNDLIGQKVQDVFSNLPTSITSLEKTITDIKLTIKNGSKDQNACFSASVIPTDRSCDCLGGVITFNLTAQEQVIENSFVKEGQRVGFANILGTSKAIVELKERMSRVAGTDSTILLFGESGTGKELFAQAIHNESRRFKGPFVPINCGAIPENLLESELFGYEEGAFTGAKRGGKPGKFELAHKGTVFLDEIGDMPLHLQVRLLRVLQEKKFERVGGIKPIWVDIRLIAATNRNLEEMIKQGSFREDLFYRLSVIPFKIPPLRERDSEVLNLAHCFLERFNATLGKGINGFSREAEHIMENYGWPGNVRELENAVEYAVNIETENMITPKSLPSRILDAVVGINIHHSHERTLEDIEKEAIINGLRQHGFNTVGKERVARALGISRATLYRKLKEYNINKIS